MTRCSAALLALVALLLPASLPAAPAADLHELTWYVHVDLIDAGAGRDLAYWEGVLDDAVDSANVLLEGGQGPFDEPCCTLLDRTVSVTTFGSPGDGLDVIDSAADQTTISALASSSSNAFLVDSITWCGGSSPNAVGCAEWPFCDGDGNDDPALWMIVTVDSFDSGTLAGVVAHERGHNACLGHTSNAACQVMQGTIFNPGLAGCFTATECGHYRNARTTLSSGLDCDCHEDTGGALADGSTCTEVSGGVCSGGVCGVSDGDAATHLVAAAGALGAAPEEALRMSALPGHWSELGPITGGGDDVQGMAYATDSSTLYGVIPSATGDDSIVTIDATTGDVIATVGSIANGSEEIISMAYDPGATGASSDDRLLVMEVDGGSGEVREIDPASPSTASLLGSIVWSPADLFTGLAYDSAQQRLFASTPFGPDGLYEIDLSSCPPSPCDAAQVAGAGLWRSDGSLAYSPESGRLYLVGTAFGEARTFYNVIDPVTGTSRETLSLDTFTPAGLAAVPVLMPEPATTHGLAAGLALLAARARRRARADA